MRFKELGQNDTRMERSNMNAIIQAVEKVSNLRVGPGLSLSDGPAGLVIALSGESRIAVGKLGVASGSYPSFSNSRVIFPARVAISPKFDASTPTAFFTEQGYEGPEVAVCNLAKCWCFENDFIFMIEIGGQWYTHHRVYATGTASADIAKGATGAVSVRGITMTVRAKFGDTVNGKIIGVEWDGTEWVISEEEC